MKEIGGYFELDNGGALPYYRDSIGLNLGRNCLKYVIRFKNIKKLYIPYYICDVVSKAAKRKVARLNFIKFMKTFYPTLIKSF